MENGSNSSSKVIKMVTWDEQYNFTINVSKVVKQPKATITGIIVKEYSSGKTYQVSYPGQIINVNEERVVVMVSVKNIGSASGTLYCEVKGQQKSAFVKAGQTTTFQFQLELPAGQNSIIVRVGH